MFYLLASILCAIVALVCLMDKLKYDQLRNKIMQKVNQPNREGTINVFVYGTLMYPGVWRGITGTEYPSDTDVAVLYKHSRHPVGGGGYPGVIPRESASEAVHGLLIRGVTPDVVSKLDRYEGVSSGLYRREVVIVIQDKKEIQANVYIWNRGAHNLRMEPWYPDQSRMNSLEWYNAVL